MSVVESLKACALFRGFTDTGIQIIAGIATERAFPKGVPLFVENMVGDSLLILADGRVRLSTKSGNDDINLGEAGPGDYLGELSLIQQGQRMCTATAMEKVLAIEIRHADFQKLLAQKPQACIKLLMGVVSLFGQKMVDSRETLRAMLVRR